ncbi:non-functional NADPH-dependent codeinone reductase 2-like [Gossypium australe]|uniref:Non-functional NADPH-dependent codeinone reductase 2-like n=1 Tax=Gossypium australe TaxID=47621 RepID=A0A5B6WPJ9_9ROSI|nr:non-functional NADPH-dependent codeinone reductase 2-like [Gossypium australe]
MVVEVQESEVGLSRSLSHSLAYMLKTKEGRGVRGSAWAAMEDCQRLGLTESIGLSNFTCKKVADILSIAKIPQVELNPFVATKEAERLLPWKWDPLVSLLFIGSRRNQVGQQ